MNGTISTFRQIATQDISGVFDQGGFGKVVSAYGASQDNLCVKDNLFKDPMTLANIYNVVEFGAVGDGVTDCTSAFAAAFASALAQWTSTHLAQIVYIPRGMYVVSSQFTPPITGLVSLLGDGRGHSIIIVSKNFNGDLFPFSNIWNLAPNGQPVFPPGATGANLSAGLRCFVQICGLGVVGDRTSTYKPNCFVFYDATDALFMSDVMVHYWPGRVIWGGIISVTTGRGCIRESTFQNITIWNSGNTGCACIEIDSNSNNGDTEGSNEMMFNFIHLYAPYGHGIFFHSSKNSCGLFRLTGVRVEGRESWFGPITGDLIRIGDPADKANTTSVMMFNTLLLNPYTDSAGLHVTSVPLAPDVPYTINFQGQFINAGGSAGIDIQIDAGRLMQFYGVYNSVKIGPTSGGVENNLFFEDAGYSSSIAWTIDPSAINSLIKTQKVPAP